MSVLIDPTSGGVSNAGQQSTLTESPEGPDAIWSGLRLACPVWKTKALGTAGGGTVFSVGEAYVSGYIVPKLNGVAQDTTRFSETDAGLGTFTFDVAPDSGWLVDVDYGVYCDEDLGLHIPTLQGKGLPARSTIGKGIGQGSGAGGRVVIAGRTSTTVRFGWTDNIYAASPTWTSNTTGLPASVSGVAYLRLDPFAPSTTALLVLRQTAGTGDEIWRNTNYRGGGTWTQMTTASTWGGSDATIVDLSFTIAEAGLLYVLDKGGNNGVMHHTHDYSTWTSLDSGTVSVVANEIAVGQHNSSLCLAPWNTAVTTALDRSTDKGHSITQLIIASEMNNPVMPYNDNPNDQIVFITHRSGGTAVWRSADQGDNFSAYTTLPATFRPKISVADANIWWGFSGTSVYKSVDYGITWTTSTAPVTVAVASLLRDAVWFIADIATPSVRTSTTFATSSFVDRSGDMATVVFGGAAVSQLAGVTPDWTT